LFLFRAKKNPAQIFIWRGPLTEMFQRTRYRITDPGTPEALDDDDDWLKKWVMMVYLYRRLVLLSIKKWSPESFASLAHMFSAVFALRGRKQLQASHGNETRL
jgi:hypothetical protein